MPLDEKWLTPLEAAALMSKLAGYKITQDDIKQMRRREKIVNIKKINDNISLYDAEEIRTVTPPKKRKPKPISTSLENS